MTLQSLVMCAGLASASATLALPDETPRLAPPFPTRDPDAWIRTPVTWQELAGRVVLVDVWTFG